MVVKHARRSLGGQHTHFSSLSLSLFSLLYSKGLVASRPDGEALEIRIARGSRVLEEHEKALVDLCSNDGASEKEVEDCVVSFLKEGYLGDLEEEDNDAIAASDDEEEDVDLVDSLYSMWAEDDVLPPPKISKESSMNDDDGKSSTKPKPWSSRSSPSGTFVRDPVTGKMKNIDA